MFEDFSKALTDIAVRGGRTAYQFATAIHNEVNADDHRVSELRHIQTVEVES